MATTKTLTRTSAKKSDVCAYWNDEPCGTRGVDARDRLAWFREIEQQRYELEPYIPPFARRRGSWKTRPRNRHRCRDRLRTVGSRRRDHYGRRPNTPSCRVDAAKVWLLRGWTRQFRKQTRRTSRSVKNRLTWFTRGVRSTTRLRPRNFVIDRGYKVGRRLME